MTNSWRVRVVEERDELQVKITALTNFLTSGKNLHVSSTDKDLMTLQLNYMRRYLSALNMRLER